MSLTMQDWANMAADLLTDGKLRTVKEIGRECNDGLDVPQGVLTAIGKALRNDPRFIRQRDQSRVTQPVWRLSNRA